jgi:hypothetical protein
MSETAVALSDEQILGIDDASTPVETPEGSESLGDSVGDQGEPESAAGEQQTAGEQTQPEPRSAPKRETQSKEGATEKTAQDEAASFQAYQNLGSVDELRELVEIDKKIFSSNFTENVEWAQQFSQEYPDAFYKLWGIGAALMAQQAPERWASAEQAIVRNYLEREFQRNADPETRAMLNQVATRFGLVQEQQDSQVSDADKAGVHEALQNYFEVQLSKALPDLPMAAHTRAKFVRQFHADMQKAMATDQKYVQSVKSLIQDGTRESLYRAGMAIGKKGLEVLPSIIQRHVKGANKSVPSDVDSNGTLLTQELANAMSDLEILSSGRTAQHRASWRPESIFDEL